MDENDRNTEERKSIPTGADGDKLPRGETSEPGPQG